MSLFDEKHQAPMRTFLITVIMLIVTVGGLWVRYIELDNRAALKAIDEKLDTLMIAVLTNTAQIHAHESESEIWKEAIKNLQNGTVAATQDRITKTEAYEALENLRKYMDKYFERKQ